jgi:hypothetical protein
MQIPTTVENKSTVLGAALKTGNFMQIKDNDSSNDGYAVFDLTDTSFDNGIVTVSWDMIIKNNGNYFFKLTGPINDLPLGEFYDTVLANIAVDTEMNISYSGYNQTFEYKKGTPVHFDCYLDLDENIWAVIINGDVIFNDVEIVNSPFSTFIVGFHNDNETSPEILVDNVKIKHFINTNWPNKNDNCPSWLPNPILSIEGIRNKLVNGTQTFNYMFDVNNYFYYPNSMFAPSSNLPACGANTNSSRTWVDFINQNNQRLYGFCALGESKNLNDIWIGGPTANNHATGIKIIMDDRLCQKYYTSNMVSVNNNMLKQLTLNVKGPGKVITSDLFTCINNSLTDNTSCVLTYLQGQKVTLTPFTLNTENEIGNFIGWTGSSCSNEDKCILNMDNDTEITAIFGATSIFPVPSTTDGINYEHIVTPITSSTMKGTKPVAVGDLNTDNITFQIKLPEFENKVDILFAISIPGGKILMLGADNTLHEFTTIDSIVFWKTSLKNKIDTTFPPIPLKNIPEGRYEIFLAVTPESNLSSYFIWTTGFENH